MLGIGLGLCYLFVRSYVRSENRETPIYRAFCRETVRSLKKTQNLSPHPCFAHPSPTMGGEFGGTGLFRLPTPLRGGVLARGRGVRLLP